MRLSIIICLSLLFSSLIFSQNRIQNSGFEQHLEFPPGLSPIKWGTINYLTDWNRTGNGIMDLCDTLLEKRTDKLFRMTSCCGNSINPHQGKGMVKLSYAEACGMYGPPSQGCASYLKSKFTSPLILGNVYRISMWVYFPGDQIEDPNIYTNIGMFLSLYPHNVGLHDLFDADYFFGDSIPLNEWYEIQHYIRALCPLEYITIGVFRNQNFPKLHRNIYNDVIYFIDDVSITEVQDETILGTIEPTPYCNYFERKKRLEDITRVEQVNIYFQSNEAALDKQDTDVLDSFYLSKEGNAGRAFIVSAYTDNEGHDNISLSYNRANSVKEYYKTKYDVEDYRIICFGRGVDNTGDNQHQEGKQLNRRATIQNSNISSIQALYRVGLQHVMNNDISQAARTFKTWLTLVSHEKRIELLLDPRLRPLMDLPVGSFLANEIRQYYKFYKQPANAFFLDSMYFSDQYYRLYTPFSLSGFLEGLDTCILCEDRSMEMDFRRNDSMNLVAIEKYLTRHGLPKISEVGRRQVHAVSNIIIHSNDSTLLKKYIPLVEANCLLGESEWNSYVQMSDRLQLLRDKPQLYGTQYILLTNKERELYKVDNIEKVNIRRRRFGLTPVPVHN